MTESLAENKGKKIPAVLRIYRGICLFPVLLGAFLWGRNLLAVKIPPGLLVLIAGMLSLCLEILYLGKKQKIFLSLVFFLFMASVTMREYAVLAEGGKELANRMIEQINQYQRTDFLLWPVEENSRGAERVFLLLCLCMGFAEVLLVSCARKKRGRNLSALCLPLLMAAAGFPVGKSPYGGGMFLVLAGFLALQMEPGKKGMLSMVAGMGLILGIAVAFSGSDKAEQMFDSYHESWLERQLHLENRILERVRQLEDGQIFFRNRIQSEVVLGNEAPGQTGAEVFQITVDSLPEQPVYIRGFIGGDYNGESWEGVSRQEFSDWAGSLGKSVRDCQEAVQNFPYEKLEKWSEKEDGPECRKVTMELKEPAEGYTLSPYYSRIPEEQNMAGDGALAPRKQQEFQWESFLTLQSWQRDGAAAYGKENPSEEIWESYQSYVGKSYTRLPEQGLERLRELADEIGKQAFDTFYMDFDVYEEAVSQGNYAGEPVGMVWQVRNRMWEDTYYSWELEPVPEGKDFAEYFLLEQKKGYCVHYATAGTLLLRMCGIPARYVSGYIVFPDDFKKNKDGSNTWTAVVTDRRGHAWTEIFQEGLGFLPMEMTPPSYTGLLAEVETEGDMKDALQELNQQEEFSENQEEQLLEEPELPEEQPVRNQQQEERLNEKVSERQKDTADTGNSQKPEKSSITDRKGQKVAMIAAAFLTIAGILFFLLWCRKKSRQKKRRAAFFQEDRAQGALALGKAMKPLLKALNLEQKTETGDLEYAAFLEEKLPGMDWERGMFLLQKSAFSRQGITEEEFRSVEKLYQTLVQKVQEEKGKLRKWFLI